MRAPAETHLSAHTRSAWRGQTLLNVTPDGWCDGEGLSGLFFREARHLSVLCLEIFGEPPRVASLAEAAPARLEATCSHPPVSHPGGGGSGSGAMGRRRGILERGLDLTVVYRVRPASLTVDVEITSRWDEEVEVELAWRLAADFADLVELIGAEEAPVAGEVAVDPEPGGIVLGPRRTDLPLTTRVDVAGVGWDWNGEALAATIRLHRQEPLRVSLKVTMSDGEPWDPAAEEARDEALLRWRESVARVSAPGSDAFCELVDRGMEQLGSLALLDGPPEEWLTPAAGVPLYPAFFGRDALTAGWQAAAFDQGQILRAAHAKACRLLGEAEDPWRDEEPGRVVQQVRRGPLARLGHNPFARYYGDVASPLMFLISLGQLYAWTGDREALESRWPDARRTLEWVRRYGDRDGDGFVEYWTSSPLGPRHQGWKDSDNAIVDENGEQVEPPLAPCEVQGYWFAALQILAVLALALGKPGEARKLWRQAGRLRDRFDEAFWMEDEGCPALALDAEKRQIRSVTSNIGHCLASGILTEERVPRVVERLFQPDLYSGWGIRTLSSDNWAYAPLSYHLGSVWPVENASILLGLRRYGFDDRSGELATALWDLAKGWRGGFLPECVGGYPREALAHPGAYPRANAPQAWNQSVWPLLVQVLLGLQPVAQLSLLAVDPMLPDWLPELELKGLRVGDASVDLRFWLGDEGESRYEVTGRTGKLRVLRQPPINDLSVGFFDRLRALLKGGSG